MTDMIYGERLGTLDEDGKRPKSRIGNAGNARQLVNKLKTEDQTRIGRYTKLQGLLDGNPPWPGNRLRDLGQGHRANINLREGEGMVDSAKTPYWNLVFTAPLLAQINFDIPEIQPHVVMEWDRKISEEFHTILKRWIGFDQNMQLSQWQMCVNGVGPMFWPHSISWKSEATKCRKVLVPQETKANVEDLEIVAILHSWRADELEGYIRGAQSTADKDYNGWNVPLCIKAIVDSAHHDGRSAWGVENYDLVQRAMRTGDLFHGISRSDRIYVASLFIKEFGGKISHYTITDQSIAQAPQVFENTEDELGYLYRKKEKFNSFSEIVCAFFFDTGPDGTWHSIKGLGPKIYDFCDVSNRSFCQMLDGAVVGSGLILETQDGANLQETQISLVGGAAVIAPNYKVVQTRIAESLNGAMAMRREFQNVLQSNTGSYRQRASDESAEPTLGQAQLNYQQQAQLSGSAINRYTVLLSLYYRETLRRLLDPAARVESVPGGKEAKHFFERCLRGIPEEALKFENILSVNAVPSVGYGSPQMMDIASGKITQLVPFMGEVGRNHALRTITAAIPGIGQAQVDAFFPPIEKSGVPDSHAALATLENNSLRQPKGQALVEPQQNHSIHFDTHAQDAAAHLQDPSASPMEQFIHLENAGPHMQKHLELLKGDPTRKNEVKQKEKVLAGLSKETDRLHQNIQESMAAQPAQPDGKPDPELLKVHGELGLKSMKLEGEMALKAKKQAVTEKLQDQKTAADIRRQNATARVA